MYWKVFIGKYAQHNPKNPPDNPKGIIININPARKGPPNLRDCILNRLFLCGVLEWVRKAFGPTIKRYIWG